MEDLQTLRKEIDEIDNSLVALFEKRMAIAEQVAAYKIQIGKPVFDKDREQEKLSSLGSMAHNEFNRCGIQQLYEQIMSISRKRQYQLLQKHNPVQDWGFTPIESLGTEGVTVVYQGVEGAYSHAAVQAFFGNQVSSFHVDTWKHAMEAIQKGDCGRTVNSL